MAAATTPADTNRELTRAREPLPVKPASDRVSSGLDRAIERSIEVPPTHHAIMLAWPMWSLHAESNTCS